MKSQLVKSNPGQISKIEIINEVPEEILWKANFNSDNSILTYDKAIKGFLSFLGIFLFILQRVFPLFFESIGLGPKPGFAIINAILFFGGVQLIFLGVIGRYLGRIYDEVKRRPQWIIKESLGIESKETSKML